MINKAHGWSKRVRILHNNSEKLIILNIARDIVIVLKPLLHVDLSIFALVAVHHGIVCLECIQELT